MSQIVSAHSIEPPAVEHLRHEWWRMNYAGWEVTIDTVGSLGPSVDHDRHELHLTMTRGSITHRRVIDLHELANNWIASVLFPTEEVPE